MLILLNKNSINRGNPFNKNIKRIVVKLKIYKQGWQILLLALSLIVSQTVVGNDESLYKRLMEASPGKDVFYVGHGAEDTDHGVKPVDRVYAGNMKSDTPTSLPGATVINTGQLLRMMQTDPNIAIIDVGYRRGTNSVPYAMFWRNMGKGKEKAGEQTNEERMARMDFLLKQIMWATPERPVIFLSGPYKGKDRPWLSYNAALRAVKLGYSNIFWYRGGQLAWKDAGLPTMSLMPPHLR